MDYLILLNITEYHYMMDYLILLNIAQWLDDEYSKNLKSFCANYEII